VSVVEKINEPRYPSFKGIMAAKKKPLTTLTLADAGIDAGQVGIAVRAVAGRVLQQQAAAPGGPGRQGRG
jgi:electron transfer flavoprotein beta subunit